MSRPPIHPNARCVAAPLPRDRMAAFYADGRTASFSDAFGAMTLTIPERQPPNVLTRNPYLERTFVRQTIGVWSPSPCEPGLRLERYQFWVEGGVTPERVQAGARAAAALAGLIEGLGAEVCPTCRGTGRLALFTSEGPCPDCSEATS